MCKATMRESSETEALVECDEREEQISTVRCHQLPRLSHTTVLRQYDGFLSIAGFPPS